jgi:hypothetical protein
MSSSADADTDSDTASSSATDSTTEQTSESSTTATDNLPDCGSEGDFEPNNAANQACRLDLNQQIRTTVGVGGDEFDYFAVSVQAGKIYGVEVDTLEDCGYQNFEVAVFGGKTTDSPELGTQARGGTLEFTADTTGIALIEIQAECKSGIYGLRVLPSVADGLVQDEVTLEPNNIPSHAHPIFAQEPATPLTLGLGLDLHDYFVFEAQAGKIYAAEIGYEPECGYNGFGTKVYGGATPTASELYSGYGPGTFVFSTIAAGPTLIDVWSKTCQTGQYSLRLLPHTKDGLVHDPATYEPNNVDANAYRLTLGQETNPSTVGLGADQRDYFYADLSAGKYFVNVVHDDDCGYKGFVVNAYGGATIHDAKLGVLDNRGSMEINPIANGPVLIEFVARCTTGVYKVSITPAP